MHGCVVCQHPKLPLIDEDLVREIPLATLAWKYHLPATELSVHREHGNSTIRELQEISGETIPQQPITLIINKHPGVRWDPPPETDEVSLQKVAEHDFRRGWTYMDESSRQRNLAWLQEQLMGLEW